MKQIRINQIKLPVRHTREELDRAVRQSLHERTTPEYRIVRQSIDARDQTALRYIYSVETDCGSRSGHELSRLLKNPNILIREPVEYDFDRMWKERRGAEEPRRLTEPPVIVGSGPAGLFCAYLLAQAGYQPIVIERGLPVEARRREIERYWAGGALNPEANIQFGEGGAGTFSDGKLNTMIKDKTGRIAYVLRTYAELGAPSDILYAHKPHIGTDILAAVVQTMRNAVCELGGQVWFRTCLTDIKTERTADGEQLREIVLQRGGREERLPCRCLVLAIGHSARDTVIHLYERGLTMSPKAFAVGLRIEHRASMIQEAQYGHSEEAGSLPAADYKLTHQTPEGRAVYSFCMCPGGYIVDASSEPGGIAVNGMSLRARNAQNSNSAIVVGVTPADFADSGPLAGIGFQRAWERAAWAAGGGCVPLQLFGDYRLNRPTTGLGSVEPDIRGRYRYANLKECLPNYVNHAIISGILAFDRRIPGFAGEDAVLCGIESRTSSPVRIDRNSDFHSNVAGVYPCGEGAGYAGGITSAAVDGIKTAEAVAAQLIPAYR